MLQLVFAVVEMKLNAWFPTITIGNDPAAIRDWAQAAEDLGYDYIEVPDHVFGAAERDDWMPRYEAHAPFHETFTTMAFLAACTKKIKLSSGVIILPQRQTGVVAKQSVEIDLLSEGRLRLGVGVGWNHVEYDALGCEWKTRGIKQAEQVEVLRMLWTQDLVSFKGRFHNYEEITICPHPLQRPIPIWIGGTASPVIKRAAKIGDGWMPIVSSYEEGSQMLDEFHHHLDHFGRSRDQVGMDAWLRAEANTPQEWAVQAEGWRGLGADYVMLYPRWRDTNVDAQIKILRDFKEVCDNY